MIALGAGADSKATAVESISASWVRSTRSSRG